MRYLVNVDVPVPREVLHVSRVLRVPERWIPGSHDTLSMWRSEKTYAWDGKVGDSLPVATRLSTFFFFFFKSGADKVQRHAVSHSEKPPPRSSFPNNREPKSSGRKTHLF